MLECTPALDTFLQRLSAQLGNRLSTDEEALAKVAADESGLPPGRAAAVIWPLTTAEVVLAAREAAALGVALVPRGGGTGKAGACMPQGGEVVVDFSRMNRLVELRPRDLYAVVQPGLITHDLDLAAGEQGFMYPPDPSSSESSTLGGNIATNAGGARALKYGVTQRYVWGLELVLPGGEVMRIGRRSIKGVAGFDLTSLLVGSEGTLGFITEAILHIVPAPQAVETAWLTYPDALTANAAAERIFAAGCLPRILELVDRIGLEAVRAQSPVPIPDGAGAALLVELDGPADRTFDELVRICDTASAGSIDSAVATSGREREAMRKTRKLVPTVLKERYPFKISDDVAVPRSRMIELLEQSQQGPAGVLVSAYGHIGDGNLHVNFLCKTAAERDAAQPLRRRMLERIVAMGGTITGEHGIGLAKRAELGIEQSVELLELQRRVKRVFDPTGIMNPGKVL